jgi:hypothetical protein
MAQSFSWSHQSPVGIISDDTVNSHPRTDISQQAISHLALVIRALELHNHAEQSPDILHAQLNQEITTMFALRDTFSPIIQSYFSLPMATLQQVPIRQYFLHSLSETTTTND